MHVPKVSFVKHVVPNSDIRSRTNVYVYCDEETGIDTKQNIIMSCTISNHGNFIDMKTY
jgi:hypothetical protein